MPKKNCGESKLRRFWNKARIYGNKQNNNAIAVIKKRDIAGCIPRSLANKKDGAGRVRHLLTRHGSKAILQVTVKAVNQAGEFSHAFIDLYDKKETLLCSATSGTTYLLDSKEILTKTNRRKDSVCKKQESKN